MGTMILNPNDESTLTSISGNTPLARDNVEGDADDAALIRFAQVYAGKMLEHNYTDSSFANKPQETSYHSELSGSLTEDTDGATSRDFDDDQPIHCVPREVTTCRDEDLSFFDQSFEVSSPLSERGDRPDRELPEPVRHCPPEILRGDVAPEVETKSAAKLNETEKKREDQSAFLSLRLTYLVITLVVMLADGLQGTHLYVLYEGYGFSVATLYCLGFATGGLASPITGPLVDKLGRKKSALLYCILEIGINMLEQYPLLPGLIVSRMVGGVTTNLLSTVFDAWLDTEYRRRGLNKEGYEIIMRDSVIVSNLAAIGSGYLAHILAERFGAVGPFEGAVTFTSIALIVIMFVWTENYGSGDHQVKGMREFLGDAVTALQMDIKVLRVGIIQGFTCASIQIFIFLWSPALRVFAQSAPAGTVGLDDLGEPAYGLIFGAFMAAGVCGGLAAPFVRRLASLMLSPVVEPVKIEGEEDVRPMAVEMLSSLCYLLSALLLLVPCLLPAEGAHSFSACLAAFLIYEFMVGLYLPCEGVIRSIYFPAEGRASIMTFPRIIVNFAVSLGVISTTFISIRAAFSSIVFLMFLSTILQLSLISTVQWSTLSDRLLRRNMATIKSTVLTECPISSKDKPDLSRLSSSSSGTGANLIDSDDEFLASSDFANKVKCE